jgi:hypothetical protein
MNLNFLKNTKRILVLLMMLSGLSAQAQDMANGGVSVGWYQQTSVTLLDGRVEVWWLENGQPRRFWQWSPNSNSWSGTEAWWGDFLYNFTLVRRKDGLLEIAGLGNDNALYVRTQNTIYGDWGPWVQRIPPSTSGSAWQHIAAKVVGDSIQYEVMPFGIYDVVYRPQLENNGNSIESNKYYNLVDTQGNRYTLYLNSSGQLTLSKLRSGWSLKNMQTEYYKNIRRLTITRRADGRIEIAAIDFNGQLHIKPQLCLRCGLSPWRKVVSPAFNNSVWTSLQVAAEGFGLRYTLKTADPACSATYMDGEGARWCNAAGFDRAR